MNNSSTQRRTMEGMADKVGGGLGAVMRHHTKQHTEENLAKLSQLGVPTYKVLTQNLDISDYHKDHTVLDELYPADRYRISIIRNDGKKLTVKGTKEEIHNKIAEEIHVPGNIKDGWGRRNAKMIVREIFPEAYGGNILFTGTNSYIMELNLNGTDWELAEGRSGTLLIMEKTSGVKDPKIYLSTDNEHEATDEDIQHALQEFANKREKSTIPDDKIRQQTYKGITRDFLENKVFKTLPTITKGSTSLFPELGNSTSAEGLPCRGYYEFVLCQNMDNGLRPIITDYNPNYTAAMVSEQSDKGRYLRDLWNTLNQNQKEGNNEDGLL